MKANVYEDVERFIEDTRPSLELNESVNSLTLGLCGQLVRHPTWIRTAPCLMTVTEGADLVISAVMTPPHRLIVVGHRQGLLEAADQLVAALVEGGWNVPGALGPREAAAAVAGAWVRAGAGRSELERRQRVYELHEVRTPAPERGHLRMAGLGDLDLVARWRYDFSLELLGSVNRGQSDRIALERVESRDVYLWEDGRPVSVAMKTRPTRHGITVSYVYTPPGSRGRGYATACVSELSRVLLSAGWRFCALFADVDNPAAIHIYQKIGYRPVCEYGEYAFSRAGRR